MRISVKLAPTFDYPVLERFWRTADELGFPAVWNYDHFYGLVDPTIPTLEGWTSLTPSSRIRSTPNSNPSPSTRDSAASTSYFPSTSRPATSG